MTAPNRVTIFSNGIADFRRSYGVRQGEPWEIALEVKKEHLADLLSSLSVYGEVRLQAPPSFTPANQEQGQLSLDADEVLEALAQQLGGARVRLQRADRTLHGTLMGLHSEPEATGGEPVQTRYLVVLADEGIRKVPLRELEQLQFEDETVRAAIRRALERNIEQVQAGSTQVRFTLETAQPQTEALVQYTVPAAAWKISYRLRQLAAGPFELQGLAIVDNNTEEDWEDFLIAVVTGEPITFETDLADTKTPHRSRVNVVQERAWGAVEPEDVMLSADMAMAERPAAMPKRRAARGGEMMAAPSAMSLSDESPSSFVAETEAREVGDYCIFESQQPVSIGANRSSMIPVFETTLDRADSVLYYKQTHHPERPYRAIRLTNSTPHSLGRGVCTVYQQGTYGGSCILPATKPGQEQLLPHALETGVRVHCEPQRRRDRLAHLRFSAGLAYTSMRQQQDVLYRITNNRDESFRLVLDHQRVLRHGELTCTLQRNGGRQPVAAPQLLSDGARIELELGPKEQLVLQASESQIEQSRVQLAAGLNVRWLYDNVVATNGPLAEDPAVLHCFEIQQAMDQKTRKLEAAQKQVAALDKKQERLRKNIKVGGGDDQTNRWRAELGRSEEQLTQLEQQTVPELQDEQAELERQLRKALQSLSAEWENRDISRKP